jgi:hypothetical protein
MTIGPIVITGASGLIGSALVEQLAGEGLELRGTSRDPEALRRSMPQLSATARWTLTSPEVLAGAHAVVHLAGENVGNAPWTEARKRAIETSRIEGTRSLVMQMGKLEPAQRPKVLVSMSAIGFYGETGERVVDERAPRGEGFLAELCERWENEAMAARAHGLRVVTPRMGLVMSPKSGALGAQLPLYKFGLGGKLGSGQQYWPIIHLRDACELIRFAIDDERIEGPLNATAPYPVRQAEFAKTLGSVLHRPAFLPAPAFALKLALGDFSQELLESRNVVPAKAQELGFSFRFERLRPMLEDLLDRR